MNSPKMPDPTASRQGFIVSLVLALTVGLIIIFSASATVHPKAECVIGGILVGIAIGGFFALLSEV